MILLSFLRIYTNEADLKDDMETILYTFSNIFLFENCNILIQS